MLNTGLQADEKYFNTNTLKVQIMARQKSINGDQSIFSCNCNFILRKLEQCYMPGRRCKWHMLMQVEPPKKSKKSEQLI